MTILVYYTCRRKYAHTHIADMNMPLVSNTFIDAIENILPKTDQSDGYL